MKGTDYTDRGDSKLSEWRNSILETGVCDNLIVDEANGLAIFNATFSKTDGKDYDTYIWRNLDYSVSVNHDWTNSGEAPEVEACGKFDDCMYREVF
ncbi:unnamed protein product [Hymenolepis diminuta]|uniref:DUF5727 domain-containing protein n=1 Tax=Hymenolepis diminuta TaxID=6216 RepID=A0A0R3SYR4_HYMDI|nr:unnamed protein product [Hymenolepis diminuta]